MEVEKEKFEALLTQMKADKKVEKDTDLDAEAMKTLTQQFKDLYKKEKGEDFPQDPKSQLMEAVQAVFRSWDNPRAIYYRRMNDIPGSWGTAVNVQAMVFGNRGDDSGTGVAFTRDPSTGEKKMYGDYLINAQGEDVVAGIRTPEPIATLKDVMPAVYDEFVAIADKLEKHYRDMQDMEFTIENGKLYMLQTRSGKRTPGAAIKIAVDLVKEGMNTKEEAVLKVDPRSLDTLLHPTFKKDQLAAAKPIAQGIAASPGAAVGQIYFSADDAVKAAGEGVKVLLVRAMTTPEDIAGMDLSQGILTSEGGKASHAAVVARQMGRCAVVGCGALKIDVKGKTVTVDGVTYKEGDFFSIDGSTGNVYAGQIDTEEVKITGDFETLMGWADAARRLKVRTNADSPKDATKAVEFGAEGIGLCRTEHMFFEEDRITAMREMILASDEESRRKALEKLLPMQRGDFEGIYKVMEDRPVTIRFLDPPLHEFLPQKDDTDEINKISKETGVAPDAILRKIDELHELNPMMGHRGCRLAVTYPEIAEVQTRAVIEAALNVKKETGRTVKPEIMIPLVGEIKELAYVKSVVEETIQVVFKERGEKVDYMIGTMIEIPRACVTADAIAEEAEFFSFGTNDLTQMGFGFSRDDAGKFLEAYYEKKIFESDPFAKLDQVGIGSLVKTAVELGRKGRPGIKLGICGEHGGDPSSVEFFHKVGLDYVSCSPFRVPIARLAAAHAAIEEKMAK